MPPRPKPFSNDIKHILLLKSPEEHLSIPSITSLLVPYLSLTCVIK